MPDHDSTIKIDDTLIQHGKSSDRAYLMRLGNSKPERIVSALEELAEEHQYGKVFAKVPESKISAFLSAGYRQEARIPGFFRGKEACLFLCRYFSEERKQEPDHRKLERVLSTAREKADAPPKQLGKNAAIRTLQIQDVRAAAEIYREVFASYPFPIDDPAYIRTTMENDVLYAGVEQNGALISLASAEMETEHGYAEMTDFATLPHRRGSSYAYHLLTFLEKHMPEYGIQTAYTIARAYSTGMNVTFARAGYSYAGRLVRNTDIAGTIESMNVWYKHLAPQRQKPVTG